MKDLESIAREIVSGRCGVVTTEGQCDDIDLEGIIFDITQALTKAAEVPLKVREMVLNAREDLDTLANAWRVNIRIEEHREFDGRERIESIRDDLSKLLALLNPIDRGEL